MSLNEEQLLHIAEPLVEYSVNNFLTGKEVAFVSLLAGFEPFTLEAYRGSGHDYYVALKAIYNYQKKHRDVETKNMLVKTFYNYLKMSYSIFDIENLFKCIDAQLRYEKESISPFRIITEEFLEETKHHIIENREKLMRKQSLNFDIWQEKLFKGLEDRYGVRVSWGKADDSMKTEKGSPIEAKSSNTVSNERTAAEADRSPEAADISLIRSEKITANVGRSPGTPVNSPIRKLLKRLVDKITGYR